MPDPTDADMDENAETREEKLYGFAWELVEGCLLYTSCRKDGEFEIRRVEMPVDGLDLVHGSLVCMG